MLKRVEAELMTWLDVERELVEAVRLHWRLPGQGGSWPFAGDGPWHLVNRVDRAGSAMDVWRQEQDEAALRSADRRLSSVPLTSDEVDWMEERLAWLLRVQDADRKLVELALKARAAGSTRIDWARIRSKLPIEVSKIGLYRRYSRAIQRIAEGVNAARLSKAA
jgi:hypothetical protein